jgi:hypothetical protein
VVAVSLVRSMVVVWLRIAVAIKTNNDNNDDFKMNFFIKML